MKRSFLLLIGFVLSVQLAAQIFNPVKWSTSFKQVSAEEFDLIFTAEIDDKWVIYSQYLEGDDGPVPTSFNYEEGSHFQLVGKNKESGDRKEAYDKVFDMTLVKFSHQAIFTQRVKISDLSKPITGYLEFMTCDDERCLPPTEEDFSFQLTSSKEFSTGAIDKAKNDPSSDQPKEDIAIASDSQSKSEENAEASANAEEPQSLVSTSEEEDFTSGGLLNPVKWDLKINKESDNLYELVFTAKMQKGWYIYSQHIEEDGPIPTSFNFESGDHFKTLGETSEEGKKKEGFDPLFDVNVIKFIESPVLFKQKVELNDINTPVAGYLEFMTCDDERCLPPTEVPFQINFANNLVLIGEESLANATLAPPSANNALLPSIDTDPIGQCGVVETVEGKGYWSIFVLGFLGGVLALLTPCVFPMIPLTVSFFTKGSENRKKGLTNAFLYGFFIFLVYLLLSLPFHLMDSINPDILNDISTNIWLNLAFFAIFLFFAFSFFGYYELTLPSSFTNRVSAAEGVGGILGVFFMALTLALVSFSCTGPILGSLLAGALSSDGGAWQLSAGMGGFGLALALPFALFAAFPGWMNTLPRSGGWLNTVKVVLGFIELGLAFKFLSNADLVKHWGALKIEPFLAIWILTCIGMGLYLFGKIKFPHDSPIKKLSLGRVLTGLVSFGFAIYLATGFIYDKDAGSYKPLKLLSGLAPPACYSWFYPCDCPQNLSCFKDFEEGVAYAKEVNKPIMIDFTGHACVNCRKMEEHVWPKGEVYKHLKDDFVLISLYVDEKVELPEDEQVVVPKATGGTRKLRNVGNKWSYFQAEVFKANSQPYYVLLSPQELKMLTPAVGYTPDAAEYADFLKCGLSTFQKLSEEKQEKEQRLGIK